MKLWYSPPSPFVRKVMVTALFAGKQLEKIDVSTTVINSDEGLRKHNPLGKIPALELDDGRVLFDSRVICAYLISDLVDHPLNPTGDARFEAMVLEALADGIKDAAVNVRYELSLRPEEYRWQSWIDAQLLKVDTALDALEAQWVDRLGGDPTVGKIAVGCALGYLDFRYPDRDWRETRPRLASWFADFANTEEMRNTAPPT
jgi:glutathione S-transferase